MLKETWRQKLSILGLGYLLNSIMQWAVEDVLYPYAIKEKGIVLGGSSMIVLAFLYCLATFAFYNWAKKDWLGIEMVKEAMVGIKTTCWARVVRFILLSIWDPFVATEYTRDPSRKYQSLSRRDWLIFLASFTIANLSWIAIVQWAIEWEEEFARIVVVLSLLSIAIPVGIAKITKVRVGKK